MSILLPIELRILSLSTRSSSSSSTASIIKSTVIRSRSSFPISNSNSFKQSTSSFSTSVLKSKSLESPTYPGLFYHSISKSLSEKLNIPEKNSWNLSYLPEPSPSDSFNPTTIGTLHPIPSRNKGKGKELGKEEEEEDNGLPPPILPRNFIENREFIQVMNEILKEAVLGDLGMETLARVRGDGFIHIADERNPSDPNRVPDPSDIIASILIQKNLLLPDSYSPSGTHRLVTMDGLMKLNDSLMIKLIDGLKIVRSIEVEVAKEEEGN